jgi:hypothetical protein
MRIAAFALQPDSPPRSVSPRWHAGRHSFIGYVKNDRLATPGIRSSTPSGASVASGANDAKVVIYDDIVFAGQRLEWSALQLAT